MPTDRPKYRPLPIYQTEDEVERVLAGGASDDLMLLPLAVGDSWPDWKFAQRVCETLSEHPNPAIRANAINTYLGWGLPGGSGGRGCRVGVVVAARGRPAGRQAQMRTVFVLQHEYEWCGREVVKMIGVFHTEAEAAAAVERLRGQPGFRDWPSGFAITPYELGADHWIEGFVILVPVLVPSRDDSGGFLVAHAVWRPGDLYELGDVDEPENALFVKGDLVRTEERSVPGHGERALVVTERVRDGA